MISVTIICIRLARGHGPFRGSPLAPGTGAIAKRERPDVEMRK